MTIEYLWIEKFKCFEKQGFNFGGENLFTIDISKLSANAITISSKKNPAYIKGFYNIPSAYQEAYITNVTALVGENGSGKTTLFDFFKGYFPDGEGEIDTNCLFINRNSDGAYTLYVYNEHDVRIEDNSGLNLKIIPNRFDSSFRATIVGTKPFRDVSIVFFSNIFDQRVESEVIGLNNISTNFLVNSEKNRLNENRTHQARYLTDIQAYHNSEVEKQLRFVSYYHQKDNLASLPFALPDKLILDWANGRAVNDLVQEVVSKFKELGSQNSDEFTSLLESLHSNLDLSRQFNKYNSKNKLLIIPIFSYLIIHTIYCILHYGINNPKIISDNPRVELGLQHATYASLRRTMTSLAFMFPAFSTEFGNLQKMLNHFVTAFRAKNIEYWEMTNRYIYNINSKTIAKLSTFLDLYFGSIIIEGALHLKWSGLSSGQIAMFNMYSRLHSLVDPSSVQRINHENVLLLLDEPDVYLHPEWQRCFMESLFKFVLTDFANFFRKNDLISHGKIQIVFSTNNPLTLSDLLPSNVVKLMRIGDGRNSKIMDCCTDSTNSTFGANLYTLLDDAFFFDNEYIGSFAKQKIEQTRELILKIENPDGHKIDKTIISDTLTLISAIGEPIIKSYLKKRLEEAITVHKGDNDFIKQLQKCLSITSKER